jgi:hypothetical protein
MYEIKINREILDELVAAYAMAVYFTDHCTLCGNRGVIDTRGVRTPAGVEVGRLNYCICYNGITLRQQGADMEWHLETS